jgi:hypothetical protein
MTMTSHNLPLAGCLTPRSDGPFMFADHPARSRLLVQIFMITNHLSRFLCGRARITFFAISAAMVCASQGAIVDSIMVNPRVFNDFSTSTLTITNNYPAQAVIDDRNLVDDGMPGTFANRHDLRFSSDGGSSAAVFDINDVVSLQTLIRLDTGVAAPRKEAGIRFNSGTTGDFLFLVNSDAGEIVAFGGGAPFHSFGNKDLGTGYTLGDTILMGLVYRGDLTPRTVEYFIDRDPSTPGGIERSGELRWDNNENGPVSFNVALYTQIAPAGASDFVTARFSNIVIPEPGSASLLACVVAGLGAFLRIRKSPPDLVRG